MASTITLEEHCISSAALDASGTALSAFPATKAKLLDVGQQRIKDMDENKITFQVLSHVPTIQTPEVCRTINDELYVAVEQHPKRFASFAMLPMESPKEAASELKRAVQELNFVGTMVPNHVNGRWLDDEYFWPIFEEAENLGVPVYVHPAFTTQDRVDLDYKGNYSHPTAIALANWTWGWHEATGLVILRLFASGLFDRYPRIKIVIGHNGEMLPYMIDRIFHFGKTTSPLGENHRSLREVWDNNIWITTAGMFSLAPLACLLRVTKIERVMFSIDYPFEENADGTEFLHELERSGLVDAEDFRKLTHKNAESLLGLEPL